MAASIRSCSSGGTPRRHLTSTHPCASSMLRTRSEIGTKSQIASRERPRQRRRARPPCIRASKPGNRGTCGKGEQQRREEEVRSWAAGARAGNRRRPYRMEEVPSKRRPSIQVSAGPVLFRRRCRGSRRRLSRR
jgi:hypothetical protein